MGSSSAAGGITSAQASLMQMLMEAQSQSAMVAAFTGQDGGATAMGSPLAGTTGTSFMDTLAQLIANDGMGLLGNGTAQAQAKGQQIAQTASVLATDLRGPRFTAFDPAQLPDLARQTWSQSGWGNGNVQCVAFVDGTYRQAGIALPFTGNAGDFWGAYQHLPGWQTIPNGQGWPQPGDILAMSGGAAGMGHVAVVTEVIPPTSDQPGHVIFAQSNSGSPTGSLTIMPDGQIAAWPGYQVQGMIRPGL